MKLLLPLIFALFFASTATAVDSATEAALAADPVAEKRLQHLSEELRCLVCQNESLAGSRADLAEDLRREVRGLIKQGKTDQEVKDFLVSRYGDFVLYAPPVKPTTWLLWGGPFVLLAAGLVALFAYLRRRGGQVGKAELTEDEKQRAEALLKDNP